MSSQRIGWPTYLTAGGVAAVVLVAMLVVSGNSHAAHRHAAGHPHTTTPATTTPTQLVFGVWGTDKEVAAYRKMAAAYNKGLTDSSSAGPGASSSPSSGTSPSSSPSSTAPAVTPNAHVTVKAYDDPAALEAALGSGEGAPNVYLLPRADLQSVIDAHENRPLQDLIADRGVSTGNDYARDAVTAFSADDDLQCMPYTVSPMVIYYNTDLIDLERMKARGLNIPSLTHSSFTLDEFRTAARFATRPRGGGKAGVAIDATLRALAPFIYSGGGQLFDNDTHPTSLALGQDGSTNALRQTLEVLRNPRLTLSSKQLRQHTALQWFERGQLGMIAGYRDLVPTLRKAKGLHFDVLPMPIVGAKKTVADFTGLCLASGQPRQLQQAADFLTYLIGDDAMTTLAKVGSLEPSNLRVAYSPAFQQPNQQPEHGTVFTDTLRYIQAEPLGVPWSELESLVDPGLAQLLTTPVLDDLDQRLDDIDLSSKSVLAPPTDSPTSSDGASAPPTPSAGSTAP